LTVDLRPFHVFEDVPLNCKSMSGDAMKTWSAFVWCHCSSVFGSAVWMSAILAALSQFVSPAIQAGELPAEWQTLSAATARLHFRKHVPSSDQRSKATADCLALSNQQAGNPAQAVAADVYPILKDVADLELAKLNSGMSPRSQAATRDMAIVGLFLGGTEKVDKNLAETLDKQAKSATDFARANQKLGELEARRVSVWHQRIRPVVIEKAGAEAEGPPLVNVQFGLLSRDVWVSVQNVSKQDLHCCTISTVTHQTEKPDLNGVWYIPELKKGETIVVDPFHTWIIPKLGDEFELQKKTLSVDFSFWSNESRVSQGKARSVDGYKIRDPFVENLISTGRVYETTNDNNVKRLRFTSIHRTEPGVGQVKFVIESDGGKTKEKYQGAWMEDRKTFSNFHPGGFNLTIRPEAVPMAAQPKGKKGAPVRGQQGQPRTSSLIWRDGRFSTNDLFGIGNDFSPVAVEISAKKDSAPEQK
jgi:hypothetical protein